MMASLKDYSAYSQLEKQYGQDYPRSQALVGGEGGLGVSILLPQEPGNEARPAPHHFYANIKETNLDLCITHMVWGVQRSMY